MWLDYRREGNVLYYNFWGSSDVVRFQETQLKEAIWDTNSFEENDNKDNILKLEDNITYLLIQHWFNHIYYINCGAQLADIIYLVKKWKLKLYSDIDINTLQTFDDFIDAWNIFVATYLLYWKNSKYTWEGLLDKALSFYYVAIQKENQIDESYGFSKDLYHWLKNILTNEELLKNIRKLIQEN